MAELKTPMSKAQGCDVPIFQLLQWKYAIRLEALGMRHSSGRSIRAHACRKLGLPLRTPAADVITQIASILSGPNQED